MKNFDAAVIEARIRKVAMGEMSLSPEVANDVAFHMTDWLDNLVAYLQFCAEPNEKSEAEVGELLTDFLVHVPNHLAAASKLYTGLPVTDVFHVGATAENSDERK
jgi:hypothetical protein